LFDFFAHIDRTFCSDFKSLIFINIGYVLKLWEANKVQQSAIAESEHCNVMSEHLLSGMRITSRSSIAFSH